MSRRRTPDHFTKFQGKMDRRIEELLVHNPETLSNGDLHDIKLSQFAKALGKNLSSRRIVNAHLRWLEAQRTGPPNQQNHHIWETVKRQWVSSLEGRGFKEHEIIQVVLEWNKRSTPGRSILTASMIRDVFKVGFPAKQTPPHSRNTDLNSPNYSEMRENTSLKRSLSSRDHYDGHGERHYEHSGNKRPRHLSHEENNNSSEPLSPDYICKRCNRKGHLLTACPTNLDPLYDTKPAEDYCCRGCNRNGDHYFTLCPLNSNSDSLNQLRKERYRQRELQERFSIGDYTPPRRTKQTISRLRFEDDEASTKETKETDYSEKGVKKLPTSNFELSFDIKQMKTGFEGKSDLIPSYNSKKPGETDKLRIQSVGFAKAAQNSASQAGSSEVSKEAVGGEDKNEMRPTLSFSPVIKEEKEDASVSPAEEFGEEEIPTSLPRLSQTPLCLSKDIVNVHARRPTALEMWDRDDEERMERKRQLALLQTSDVMEGVVGSDSLNTTGRSMNGDSSPHEIVRYASEEPEMPSAPASLRGESNLTGGESHDVQEPQVLRVTLLETETAQWEIQQLFREHEITAVSVWKPSFIRPPATKSAFVSLSSASRAEAEWCCKELSGRVVRGVRVKVSHINNQEAFQQAMDEFKKDVKKNEEFRKNPIYHSYSDQHRQILQHLRLTDTFNPSQYENRSPLGSGGSTSNIGRLSYEDGDDVDMKD